MSEQQILFDNTIKKIVEKFKANNNISSEIIRDDVIAILEKYCTVVYYPLEKEEINGFHVTRTVKGEKKHFVYINTDNTIERQNFVAAHEIGHMFDAYGKAKEEIPFIDEYVRSVDTPDSPEEYVANKFAAELMMPLGRFKEETIKELRELEHKGTSISKIDLLRLIIGLMNTFFVGYKATTRRLLEIGSISKKTYETIKKFENDEIFKSLLKEGEYKRLNQRTGHKNITNLTENIRKAEEKNCVIEGTIEYLKTEFDISVGEFSEQNDEFDFKEV